MIKDLLEETDLLDFIPQEATPIWMGSKGKSELIIFQHNQDYYVVRRTPNGFGYAGKITDEIIESIKKSLARHYRS